MSKRENLLDQKFGRLLVIDEAPYHVSPSGRKHVKWKCQCDCGKVKEVLATSLKSGTTNSCGCFRKDINTKHGMRQTPTYKSWCHMKARCYNPNTEMYPHYGGRGITVCDRWLNSFENFLEDMGEKLEGTSIDRIDNDGNYEPSNCEWATSRKQASHTSQTKLNPDLVKYIREQRATGRTYKDLSTELRINWHTIRRAAISETWAYVS